MAEYMFEQLPFFVGVVEDRQDPQFLGRVRVRVFDLHSEDKNELPTEDLPWAIPVSGSHHNDYKPPLEGTWVIGVFFDGRDAQHPVVLGSLLGMPSSFIDFNKGFNSTSDINPSPYDLYQPDIPRLARGEDIQETSIPNKMIDRTIAEEYDFEEPVTSYNAIYPYNKASVSESGHVFELDDTPGSERIHLQHKGGTSFEIQPNGTLLEKIYGDDYTIVINNRKVYVEGKCDLIVKGSINIISENDCNITVNGNANTNIHGDYNLNVGGRFNIVSGEGFSVKSSSIRQEAFLENVSIHAKQNVKIDSGNNTTISAVGGYASLYARSNLSLTADQQMFVESTGKMNIIGGGNVAIDGPRVDLNNNAAQSQKIGIVYADKPLAGLPIDRRGTYENVKIVEPYSKFTDPPRPWDDEHVREI